MRSFPAIIKGSHGSIIDSRFPGSLIAGSESLGGNDLSEGYDSEPLKEKLEYKPEAGWIPRKQDNIRLTRYLFCQTLWFLSDSP